MKDFHELALKRQSCKKFNGKLIDKEKLLELIEIGRLAPSAVNGQPWHFLVVVDPKIKKKLTSSMQQFNDDAAAFIVIVEEKSNLISILGVKIKDQDYAQFDIGIVSAYLALAAADLGIENVIVGWFNEYEVKKLLSIDKKKRVRLIISLGYSDDTKIRVKARQSMDQVSDFI